MSLSDCIEDVTPVDSNWSGDIVRVSDLKKAVQELIKEINLEIVEAKNHNTENAKQSILVYNIVLSGIRRKFGHQLTDSQQTKTEDVLKGQQTQTPFSSELRAVETVDENQGEDSEPTRYSKESSSDFNKELHAQ